MRILFALVLVAVIGHTAAAKTCAARGPMLLEIRWREGSDAKVVATMKLYESGAWHDDDPRRKPHPKVLDTGCLDAKALRKVRAALKAATWKTVPFKGTCEAPDDHSEELIVRGKVVFTARTCNDALDAKNAGYLHEVRKQLALAQIVVEPVDAR